MANQPLTALGFVKSRPDLERPDLEIFCNPVRLDADVWFPVIKPALEHAFEACPSLLHPHSRGEVTLRSADPADAPRILFNFLKEEEDRRAMREGVRIVREMYRGGPVGEMIDRELKPGAGVTSDADLDAYIRSSMDLDHHPDLHLRPWARRRTPWPWSILSSGCGASRPCGWSTPRSCRG
ncbi:MAG: GMC oxidoreductase [Caulobacteraceae bacterium]